MRAWWVQNTKLQHFAEHFSANAKPKGGIEFKADGSDGVAVGLVAKV